MDTPTWSPRASGSRAPRASRLGHSACSSAVGGWPGRIRLNGVGRSVHTTIRDARALSGSEMAVETATTVSEARVVARSAKTAVMRAVERAADRGERRRGASDRMSTASWTASGVETRIATTLAASAGKSTVDARRGEPGTHTARAARTGLGLRPYHAPDQQQLATNTWEEAQPRSRERHKLHRTRP